MTIRDARAVLLALLSGLLLGCPTKTAHYSINDPFAGANEGYLVVVMSNPFDKHRIDFRSLSNRAVFTTDYMKSGSRLLILRLPADDYYVDSFRVEAVKITGGSARRFRVMAGATNYVGHVTVLPTGKGYGHVADVLWTDNQNYTEGYLRSNYPELIKQFPLRYAPL